MSSDTDASAIAAVFSELYTGEYCNAAACVLFIYEVCITLDREVACFWTPKQSKSGARLLFLANKWIGVIVSALTFAQMASFSSDKSCTAFTMVGAIFPGLQFIPGAVFSALRGYVLSRSKPIALLILVLSLTPLGVNMVQYGYNLQGVLFPPFGCAVTDETTASIQMKFLYISRVPLIVADALLICVTWSKLSSRDVLRGISRSKRLSLSDVLLRDGTIYFIVLFVMNILHLSLSLAALAIGADGASNVSIFTAPITAILISRFLLQLQELRSSYRASSYNCRKRTSRSSESTSTTRCTPRGTPTMTCRASSRLSELSSTRIC
ncbi:hypothetical protein L226DRAFT_540583 [Lentinus tigrinus ALCF2SS1-7]|uniref:uncharacterized protein n=1 Tax=Lentinus tigrinus ALCF2SS1-7 TaxID=1328758 RepID=UPI0011663F5A|nr:hypothetical protein L226DRAFT_540583 [Lentinus tigrinus ALCF2SS1-7]